MEPRFNMFENEVTSKFFKRLIAASRPIEESSLPKATQELVKIRASQINGCGMCLDMHTKDAAASGEAPRLRAASMVERSSDAIAPATSSATNGVCFQTKVTMMPRQSR